MKNAAIKKLFALKSVAEKRLSNISSAEREKLGKKLDVEHAYYSSVLEGSMLDRSEFEKLAKDIQ